MQSQQTLENLYEKRQPLYEKYADVTIDCAGHDIDGVLAELLFKLKSYSELFSKP